MMPLISKRSQKLQRQQGAGLIAVIFIITALASLGGLMTQMMVLGSEETIDEWYSSQALYAAESGVEYAAWSLANSGTGVIANGVVVTNQAWMSTAVNTVVINGVSNLYTITSTGTAGGTSGTPRTQRQIIVEYMLP